MLVLYQCQFLSFNHCTVFTNNVHNIVGGVSFITMSSASFIIPLMLFQNK